MMIKSENVADIFPSHQTKGRRVRKGEGLVGKFFHPGKSRLTDIGIDRQPRDELTLHLNLRPLDCMGRSSPVKQEGHRFLKDGLT